MLRLTHPDQVPEDVRRRGSAVTIGTFDGMHRGHRAVLARLVDEARSHDLASIVLTFHPHPLEVLHPERAPEAICSLEQRLEHLERAGVDVVVAQAFTHELAAQSPREFVTETYVRNFGMRRIVVGRDSRFGRHNAGTVDTLRELGEVDTTRVAMHPGSVQGFGLLGDERTPTFLLPSNPVSALVIAETFIRPAIRRSLGKTAVTRRTVKARSLRELDSIPGRRGFIRARLMRDVDSGEYLVEPLSALEAGPTHLLAGFAEANAMVHLPEDAIHVRPGDIVDVEFLHQRS